jgi:hypothetical protein
MAGMGDNSLRIHTISPERRLAVSAILTVFWMIMNEGCFSGPYATVFHFKPD